MSNRAGMEECGPRAAHLQTYCVANPEKTPLDGVQELMLKMLKTGSDTSPRQ
jgi:hypothetical protein